MPQVPSIKISWKIMLTMGIYLVALGGFLIAVPKPSFREAFTAFPGNSWTDFTSANAKLSELFLIMEKFVGANVLSAAVLVVGITLPSSSK